MLARASVTNPIARGSNFDLTSSAQRLLSANNVDGFKSAFGDSFVRGIKTGGEFFAVFRLTALRQTTQESLASTLSAEINGVVASGSFGAQFNQSHSDEKDLSDVEVSFYQASGSGPTASVTLDVQSILQRLKDFPTIAKNDPMPYKVELATYDTIPIPIPTPEERDDFLLSLSQVDAKKLDYIRRKNDVDFALQHPEYFDTLPDPAVLQSDSEIYTQLINAVIKHAVQLAKGQFATPEIFDPAKVNLTEPAPVQFKRRASAPDLTIFQGDWSNTNGQGKLSHMTIVQTDPLHANVRARYSDFPGEFVSTAEWSPTDQALSGGVTLKQGQSSGNIASPHIFSSYKITNPASDAQVLVVSNSQGSVLNSNTFVDTFRRGQ